MVASDETGCAGAWQTTVMAFAFVWIAGIVLSLVILRLAISGSLWNLGFPSWLITLSVLVGVWQWIWIAPLLRWARRRHRDALYKGLLYGGGSFSALQLALYLVLGFMLRKFSLQ